MLLSFSYWKVRNDFYSWLLIILTLTHMLYIYFPPYFYTCYFVLIWILKKLFSYETWNFVFQIFLSSLNWIIYFFNNALVRVKMKLRWKAIWSIVLAYLTIQKLLIYSLYSLNIAFSMTVLVAIFNLFMWFVYKFGSAN